MKYTISTDAITETIEAGSADEAAAKFASTEPLYYGCLTVADLMSRAESLGGWVSVSECGDDRR